MLGRPDVGADDDFFSLGGDSILSITVATRARSRGLEVGPRDVFARRTPAAIAAGLPATEHRCRAADVGDVVPLPIVHQLRTDGGPIERFHLSTMVRTLLAGGQPPGRTTDNPVSTTSRRIGPTYAHCHCERADRR